MKTRRRKYQMRKKRPGLFTKGVKERMNRALRRMGLIGKRVSPWAHTVYKIKG